jgi:hypothetical protein
VQVKAEMVQSPEKIYLGLSYRPELPEGQGIRVGDPVKW